MTEQGRDTERKTQRDQKPTGDMSKAPSPAASLTHVSIRRAAIHRAADIMPPAHPEHPAYPDHIVDHGKVQNLFGHTPVIDVCTDTSPETSEPAPRRVFPTANMQTIEATDVPASRNAHPEPTRPVGASADVAPAAIIDLWEHLAANRLRPNMSDIDPITIAGQWPNSLLLRVTEHGRRPGMEVAHMFAPPAGGPTSAIPIDAMTVDWIVGLGREVVVTGGPIHETDAVPTARGPIDCGVIALPFGTEQGVDHVLCHLYRVDERVVEGEINGDLSLPPRDRTGIKRLFGR